MYRNVITDMLYREPDKWRICGSMNIDDYIYYKDEKLEIWYYVFKFGKNITIQLRNGGGNLRIRDCRNISKLGFKMMEEANRRNQQKLDSRFFEAVPLTARRRLKIEKIYNNMK